MFAKHALKAGLLALVLPVSLLAQQQPPTPPKPPAGQPPVVTPSEPTAAQQAAAAKGMQVTNQQIADAIKNSGLSEPQIRDRLKSAGYDPGIADPFFSGPQPGAQPALASAAPQSDFAKALINLGILSGPIEGAETGSDESTRRNVEQLSSRAGGVFGKSVFDRATTAFDPITSGPVDAGYRLGVGDVLQLVTTGQVELAYQLDIRRDGTVIIPQVGQIPIAGLTLDAARVLLRTRMAQSYSSLSSGEARLDLTVARLRTNAVFVIGEVESPGAMQVNALSTVFHAIARAGGPTDRGSFRDIEVRRAGQVIERLDLYDYLLNGNAVGDIRLQQGDVIYVPLNHRAVAITGAVRRPRIFQLRENEGFADLLKFAGGLLPTASVERVQIDRILPPEKRSPGFERVKVDVDLKGNLDSLSHVKVFDGDIITVFDIGAVRRNVIDIAGQVFQPGEYEFRPKMTIDSLIGQAQGLLPWAMANQIKVVRQVPLSGRGELFSVDATTPAGRAFELEEFDSVEVLDSRSAYPGGQVVIDGAVNGPATRPFLERETLRDAIERAGGLREDAQVVEVYRRKTHAAYNDTTSVEFQFPLAAAFTLDSAAGRFLLERDDHIFVRSSPGFRAQRFVTLAGRFRYDGEYAINENRDRISDVVERAGGVLPGGYAQGFKLLRDGKPVAIDFDLAMKHDKLNDIPLLGGDHLVIERDPGTVLVAGAVSRPSLVRYQPGLSVHDYIELAGGPAENGDANRAVVDYPSGFSKRVRRVALIMHSSPDVVSGSTISVPEKPESKTTAGEVWAKLLSSASVLASLAIAYKAVTR